MSIINLYLLLTKRFCNWEANWKEKLKEIKNCVFSNTEKCVLEAIPCRKLVNTLSAGN